MTNSSLISRAILAATLSTIAGLASAGDTQNLTVNATVQQMCKFYGSAPTAAFGDIDPSGTSNVTANATVQYKCTNGTPAPALAPTTGTLSRTMSDGGSNTLAYVLSLAATSAGSGFGSGQEKSVAVTATITPTQFQNAVAATYEEVVELTITP
ncbi:MAG: Spore Coat Protein domain [Ramlibacter sp.]|jgi:hypothetical protein|nr:Spore Coat Protein domain [Ramlibacter sp.]